MCLDDVDIKWVTEDLERLGLSADILEGNHLGELHCIVLLSCLSNGSRSTNRSVREFSWASLSRLKELFPELAKVNKLLV
jgi:hypothetical protein